MSGHSFLGLRDFGAPLLDPGFNAVPDFAGAGEPLLMAPPEAGWIGEAPMQTSRDAGEDRTALGAALVTDGDNVGEALAGLEGIENGFCSVAGDVDTDFPHRLDHNRIECVGLETGAMGFKLVPANVIEKGFRHLAARAVVTTDEEHFFPLHNALQPRA
jgi:hypothetical protein